MHLRPVSNWAARFKQSGIRECPRWEKVETIGEVNKDVVSAYAQLLPRLDPKQGTTVREEPPAAKQNFRYKVYFESGNQDKACTDPGSCAAACVGGFPGALVKADGDTIVLDPDYWLDPNVTTVYRVGGYYHGMSYKGGVPGDLWGHANRAGESCSYYYFEDGNHYLGYLAKVPAVGIFASEMTECMPL